MGLITKEVEIGASNVNVIRFESLGYEIPKYKDSRGKLRIKIGTKIIIKVEDLSEKSGAKVLVKCDCPDCKSPYLKPMTFQAYNKSLRKDGKYYCLLCSRTIWDLKSMNQYCIDKNNGYTILDIRWVDKPYQKQLWALIKCLNPNHDAYWGWWNNFVTGYMCKQCDYENNDKTMWNGELITNFYKIYNLDIIDIKDWKDVDTNISCINKDGYKVFISITGLKQNNTPSIFTFFNPHSLDNLNRYCKLNRSDYEIISDKYIDIKTLYTWKYNGELLPETENKLFQLTADSFIHGNCGHPYFSKSKGALMFAELLNQNQVEYIREKTFEGCKDKSLLQFDFYIPIINEIIEIDGLQHGMVVKYWGGEEGLKDRIKKDKIKDDFCQNNIKLTRIPYDHKNIDQYKISINEKIVDILYKIKYINNFNGLEVI